jgi:putative transcriptional regulator
VIRFRFKELLADKGFRERRNVTIAEVAEATGIHRITLSKIANHPGYNTGTDNLDRLCRYFGCSLDALAQYLPEE